MDPNTPILSQTASYLFHIAFIVVIALVLLVILKKYFNGSMNPLTRDLTGQVIIITGSNCGIGLETAKGLAKTGATIVLACLDEKLGRKAEQIMNSIKQGSAQYLHLDLGDLNSIRLFVNEFNSKYSRLDILVNNAGIMRMSSKTYTKDGFESHIGINYLGHFLLTNLLLEKLKKAPSFRVINISSINHTVGKIDLDDLHYERRSIGPFEGYSQSKLANILFTQALQRRFDLNNLNGKAVSLHPGIVRTEITRSYTGIMEVLFKMVSPIFYLFSKSSFQGAQTTLYCVFKQFDQLEKGAYFSDCAVKPTNNKQINTETSERLWEISAKLVKL